MPVTPQKGMIVNFRRDVKRLNAKPVRLDKRTFVGLIVNVNDDGTVNVAYWDSLGNNNAERNCAYGHNDRQWSELTTA